MRFIRNWLRARRERVLTETATELAHEIRELRLDLKAKLRVATPTAINMAEMVESLASTGKVSDMRRALTLSRRIRRGLG
jgi:hypothetical protein